LFNWPTDNSLAETNAKGMSFYATNLIVYASVLPSFVSTPFTCGWAFECKWSRPHAFLVVQQTASKHLRQSTNVLLDVVTRV